MGQIIIDLPSRIKRRYRLDDEELTNSILASLEAAALPVKTNSSKLTAEDKADIRDALAAKKEMMETGEFYTTEEIRSMLNL